MKDYKLSYNKPACFEGEDYVRIRKEDIRNLSDTPAGHDCRVDGWEQYSLPIGNGYFGVNVFGRTATERLQVTENSLSNPYSAIGYGGLNSFLNLYFDFAHDQVSEFERGLDLNNAIAYVKYRHENTVYKREYFTSYPAKVLVCRFEASGQGAVTFDLKAEIPFLCDYLYHEGDGCGKSGSIVVENNEITVKGEMAYYGIKYAAIIHVQTDGGSVIPDLSKIRVLGADSATVTATFGTNYRLEERVFTEENPRLKLSPYDSPYGDLRKTIQVAALNGYDELRAQHILDYRSLFERVTLSLGTQQSCLCTDELLEACKQKRHSTFLDELYFHYGRYLLISSSRPGTYPANLQGTWNKYQVPPWSGGYWHNINVQMNYWPAFNTNLHECFEPYMEYFKAYLPLAKKMADRYIEEAAPENADESGKNGWTICTAAWLYTLLEDEVQGRHSGPGTTGFTSKLLWDYYDFTRHEKVLEDTVYDALYGVCAFFSKAVIEKDGCFLMKYSASPEQMHNGKRYETQGCAFDQQMIYESYKDFLTASQLLGQENEMTKTVRRQIDRLEPVLIGQDGQVKEYREEEHYGDIGEYHHRHISHLVGLYPGTSISANTPKYLDGAKITLEKRGDLSTGWATAYRMILWARAKQGNRAHRMLELLLGNCTFPNLWSAHPPFQIDGNFGSTAAIAEMLLQSHEGYIHILPALPDAWAHGSFSGLTARGAFTVSAKWVDKKLQELSIISNQGGKLSVLGQYDVKHKNGTDAAYVYQNKLTTLCTQRNETYIFMSNREDCCV